MPAANIALQRKLLRAVEPQLLKKSGTTTVEEKWNYRCFFPLSKVAGISGEPKHEKSLTRQHG